MARYIDADKLIKSFELSIMSWGRDCNSSAPIMMRAYQDALYRVKNVPTADVVPKSEIETLQEEVNRYKRYFFRHDYDEMIAEVLDKLDRFINSNCIEIKDERGIKGYVTSGVHFAIAEFKKKYTEEKK